MTAPSSASRTDGAPVPVRPAATVMLVRDDPSGALEVLMVRRHPGSVFVPDAHVFPGGAVDPEDSAPTVSDVVTGLSNETATAVLGVGDNALAYWVAAIRETFEEAGLLLARTSDGNDPFAEPARAARLAAARAEVDAGRHTLEQLCRDESLKLDLGLLRSFGRWITPIGAPRRYDTRFFIAPAPAAQDVVVDQREAVDHEWLRPSAALDRFGAGEIDLILPTERSLAFLAEHEHAASLFNWLDTAPPEIDDHGGWRLAGPTDRDAAVRRRPSATPVPVGEP